MAKRPRVAVVGSANIDLTTFAERFPKPGETIFGRSCNLGFGGKGANQAVAARLCGADVFMVARVGSDLFGVVHARHYTGSRRRASIETVRQESAVIIMRHTCTSDT